MFQQHPTVLFDGQCMLCTASVLWLIRHDRRQVFRFAALQSEAARELLSQTTKSQLPRESVVLIDALGFHVKSRATIEICRHLGFPWTLALVALLVPSFIRDGIYTCIAKHRYRWFGKRDSCLVPGGELRSRFLDAGELSLGVPAKRDKCEMTHQKSEH